MQLLCTLVRKGNRRLVSKLGTDVRETCLYVLMPWVSDLPLKAKRLELRACRCCVVVALTDLGRWERVHPAEHQRVGTLYSLTGSQLRVTHFAP